MQLMEENQNMGSVSHIVRVCLNPDNRCCRSEIRVSNGTSALQNLAHGSRQTEPACEPACEPSYLAPVPWPRLTAYSDYLAHVAQLCQLSELMELGAPHNHLTFT